MSEFFEIAYAAASGRLCLFTGTGFSKAVTENKAPSWQGLLELMCDMTNDPATLKKALFPKNGTPPPEFGRGRTGYIAGIIKKRNINT